MVFIRLILTRLKMKEYYCARAFSDFVIIDNGYGRVCACPMWNNDYFLGNLLEDDDVWNGPAAQAFRASILDGSFKFCNKKRCPYLITKFPNSITPIRKWSDLPLDRSWTLEGIKDDLLKRNTILSYRPRDVYLAYDKSCNLTCPSCRDHIWSYTPEEQKRIERLHDIVVTKYLPDAHRIFLGGAGETLAGSIFPKFLQQASSEMFNQLKFISIYTNGLRFKKAYPTFSPFTQEKLKFVEISIDAASSETYAINRRGGDWEELKENLSFITELKRQKKIARINIHFVVQQNNYHEMFKFVEFGNQHLADTIDFQMFATHLIRWTKPNSYFYEWEEKAVQEPNHPEHAKFMAVLDSFCAQYRDEISKGKISLGVLADVYQRKYSSQRDRLFKEFTELQRNNETTS